MKFVELFAMLFVVNLLIVNAVMFVLLPLVGVYFGMNLFVNLLIPAAFAAVAVESAVNRERQMMLYSRA
ncbi:MAG: hypothetical protein IJ237_05525 [Oscillospiraceae bacterium]|nr:hypothetical protein [Oscillospiraceae bacterium]